ncbi:hypothetical protein P4H66_05750 [Paenibacillus dokdonensis]|uniref:Uncharacterized protein n=1 Tax=Paenibacillus dokdonensis TaxID=2567944 RepID=A0ABU6GMH8_9BACL|nr:hypothetical protein [Paenibacillus dokdonensis]MEC0239362.1 hypothetical protein [Paenibacillus dokdonensis]
MTILLGMMPSFDRVSSAIFRSMKRIASKAEVMLLFPGNEEAGAKSPDMFALFTQCMNEPREDATLRPDIETEAAVSFLISTFYGGFLTSRLYGSKDVMAFYETHLKLIEK